MQILRDKLREVAAICEGEIIKREATIIALKRERELLKKELAKAKDQQLTVRPPKCTGCIYRVVATRILDGEKKEG